MNCIIMVHGTMHIIPIRLNVLHHVINFWLVKQSARLQKNFQRLNRRFKAATHLIFGWVNMCLIVFDWYYNTYFRFINVILVVYNLFFSFNDCFLECTLGCSSFCNQILSRCTFPSSLCIFLRFQPKTLLPHWCHLAN